MGAKQLLTYVVETEEWNSSVTRKYKQFLWLYDKMAEGFPCISLPPLPVKQNSCEIVAVIVDVVGFFVSLFVVCVGSYILNT